MPLSFSSRREMLLIFFSQRYTPDKHIMIMTLHLIISTIILFFKKKIHILSHSFLLSWPLSSVSSFFSNSVSVGRGLLKNMITCCPIQQTQATEWASHPLPCPWDINPAHCSYSRSHFKDAVLRQQTYGNHLTVYVTQPC